jgi:hypothetical protein
MLAGMPTTPGWMSPEPTFLDDRCPLPLDRPFTAAEAGGLGVSRHTLARLVEMSLVRPLARGTYVAAQAVDTIEIRAEALRLVVADTAVVTDRTAAWLHGVDILPRGAVHEAPPIQVFGRTGSRLRRPQVASGVRTLRDSDVMVVSGIRVTTPLRTALDLGRLLGRFDALAALDGFLRIGVPHDRVLSEVERFKGERGVVQLRHLAPLADGRAESPPESALRLHWYDAGLPRPEPQWWVHDDAGFAVYRLDLALPACRYAAEYDGERFHTASDAERDEVRRTWLDQERGWLIDVFDKSDLYASIGDPARRLITGVRRARSRAGLWVPQSRYQRG